MPRIKKIELADYHEVDPAYLFAVYHRHQRLFNLPKIAPLWPNLDPASRAALNQLARRMTIMIKLIAEAQGGGRFHGPDYYCTHDPVHEEVIFHITYVNKFTGKTVNLNGRVYTGLLTFGQKGQPLGSILDEEESDAA